MKTSPFVLLRVLRPVASLLAAAFVVPALSAQDSPFLPDGFGAPPAPTAAATPLDRFEFTGVMSIGNETSVTLFDTSTSKSVVLVVGELVDDLRVSDYRSDEGTIRVESRGQFRTITLRAAKIVAMAAPPPPPPSVPPGVQVANGGPAQPGGVPPGPAMSDEEARRRMEQVAGEIRRRREMRRQMLEQNQGQQAPRPVTQ